MPRFRVFLPLVWLPITACGPERGGAHAPIVYYESYDPRSLDPARSTDVPTGEMVTLLYDGLTRFDADGALHPALADRWSVAAAGRRYVFHLRPGVTFRDGAPLTAAAVRASYLRVLDPRSTGGRAWPLLPIAGATAFSAGQAPTVSGIEALGDTALALTLAEPLAIFPKFLAMPVAAIVSPNAPADLDAEPDGTGPWRLAGWAHDDQLRFARNPDYWDGAPQAESLTVRIVPDQLVRAAEFESGRLDVVEVPFGETARWRERHADQLHEKPALRVTYIALNTQRAALRDARVRQAINYAVNVPQILATVWSGRGIRARGAIPPVLPGGDTTRAGYAYDPARARELLAAAGVSGLVLELWRTADNETLGRVAQAVQADLAAVGIRVTLVSRDASSQRAAARAGTADMALLDWWADYPDGDNFLYPLFHSHSFGAGGNYAFYADPVTDSLIDAARRTLDDTRRTALYRSIDERVYRAAPWLYLWFPVDLWAEAPRVTGWDLPVIFNGQRWTAVRRAP